jgi:hypothetical protein
MAVTAVESSAAKPPDPAGTGGSPHRPDPPTPPTANVTDLLLNLAGAAESWQRTLLDAHGALAARSGPDPTADQHTDQFEIAVGTAAIEAVLVRLLRRARRVSVWLHPRVAGSPAATSPVDLLGLAARQPGLKTRALLGAADNEPLPTTLVPRGEPAPDVRVTSSRNPTGAARHDTMVLDVGAVAILACDSDGQPTTVVVAQPVLAGVVQSFFDSLWTNAVPVPHVLRMQSVLGGRVKQEILRRLADGDKDEAIARGLGISLRTCRRYIAEIIAAAGAVSRFQAGFLLAFDQPACFTDLKAAS